VRSWLTTRSRRTQLLAALRLTSAPLNSVVRQQPHMDQAAIVGLPSPWHKAAPFFVGVTIPIAAYRITQVLGVGTSAGILIAAFFLFGIGATWASWVSPMGRWAVALILYAGVPVGTLIDVIIDWVAFSHDRNMFPFEIIQWWVVGPIPVATGVFVGRTLRDQLAK
jgi:hypothetical protein